MILSHEKVSDETLLVEEEINNKNETVTKHIKSKLGPHSNKGEPLH